MIFQLLTDASGDKTNNGSPWLYIVLIVVVIVAFAAWMIFSGRKDKERRKEYAEQLEAIKPGHKVKTIGGVCGIVVEVCDDNTVIIETGSEAAGKSYVKMDKECIAQTDAKGPSQIAREEAEERRKAEKEAKKAGVPLEAGVTEPEKAAEPMKEEKAETAEPAEEAEAVEAEPEKKSGKNGKKQAKPQAAEPEADTTEPKNE